MPDDSYSFAQTRARLEDIVAEVRRKDVSLEKSLDLLEEGVRLANQCTELIDHADWDAAGEPAPGDVTDDSEVAEASSPDEQSEPAEPESSAPASEDIAGGDSA